jgi:hypothetical protein
MGLSGTKLDHWEQDLEGDIGTPPIPVFTSQLPWGEQPSPLCAATMMYSAATGPKQQGQMSTDWKHLQRTFPPLKLIIPSTLSQ